MLFLIWTLFFSQAFASGDQCLVGDPSLRFLSQQLKSDGDPVLRAWHHYQAPQPSACPSNTKPIVVRPETWYEHLEDHLGPVPHEASANIRLKNPQKKIDPDCVKKAVVTRVSNTLVSRNNCYAEKAPRAQVHAVPCLDDDYVKFVSFVANQAIKCLASADDPINPQTIFRLINNESAFGSFLAYSGGVGITQMTTNAARDMSEQGGAAFLNGLVDDHLHESPGGPCTMVQAVLDHPVKIQHVLDQGCAYMSPGLGVARGLVQGIGLFLYNRDYRNGGLRERMKDLNLSRREKEKILDEFALVAFSRWGPAGAAHLYEKYASRLKSGWTHKKLMQDLLVSKERGAEYIQAIDRAMDQIGNPSCAL